MTESNLRDFYTNFLDGFQLFLGFDLHGNCIISYSVNVHDVDFKTHIMWELLRMN
jgi:hypothetical protein